MGLGDKETPAAMDIGPGRRWYRRWELVISIVVTVVGVAVFILIESGSQAAAPAFIRNIELRSLDARFVLRGVRPPDPRIVTIGLDERTLEKVGSHPIARNYYARLVDKLSEGDAAVVAFDITFSKPEKNSAVEALKRLESEVKGQAPLAVLDRIRQIERTSDNDVILAESLKKAGNVVIGHIFLSRERAKSQDEPAVAEYYDVLWGQPFPQMRPVASTRKFDLGGAWRAGNGIIAEGIEPNIRIVAEAAQSYGFFNSEPDGDGTYRRGILLIRYENGRLGAAEWYPSLAMEALRRAEHIPNEAIAGLMAPSGLDHIELGKHIIKTNSDGTVLINYAGPFRTYAQYSMIDVIDGTVPASTFKDKIVFVGPTALGIGDIRPTPFQSAEYMGVEIHANIVDNILHNAEPGRGFLNRGKNEEIIDILFLLAFGLGMGYLFGQARPMLSTAALIASFALFTFITYISFARFGMWLSFVLPAGVLVVNYASVTSFRMIFEEREKRKIRRAFGQYVAPSIISLIEKDPQKYFKPGGEMKELTIMFSDIRAFTSIAEGMTPDELVRVLNIYLGEMTDVLFKSWGTLDKYIGDAIMAFWGSPYPQEEHAIRAAACALDMLERLARINEGFVREGGKPLHIGIGLNTGPVNVGNMGSEKRLSWTVMGDHVNLASRLEGMTKQYHCSILISEFTYAQVQGAFVCRELDRIRVKGRSQPVAIYELMSYLPDFVKHADRLARYESALAAYREHAWARAIELFEDVLAHYPDDGPSQLLLKRCVEFRAESPAEDWDGVYVMRTK